MKAILPVLMGVSFALAQALVQAEEAAQKPLELSIESQSLRDALNAWAQQTGYQLIAEIKDEFVAPRVEGKLTAQEALEQLLKGTPLTYRWMGERLVAVKEKPTVVPAALQKTQHDDGPPLQIARLVDDGERVGRRVAAGSEPSSAGPSFTRVPTSDERPVAELEEVVVTGTHIRGASPVGSPIIVMRREEMLASGHGQVQDLFDFLPQNFGGSASADSNRDTGTVNLTRGQAVDLRGLGASSTLVLIDGRRLAAGGLEGAYVDISSIPMAAIERVEILTDGASALYGSDAVGGVVNFITRTDFNGLEASARFASTDGTRDEQQASIVGGTSWSGGGNLLAGYQYTRRDPLMNADTPYGSRNRDFRAFGGSDFRVPGGSPGVIFDSAGVPRYEIPEGQDGTALTTADLIPISTPSRFRDNVTGIDALPEEEIQSGFLNVRQPIGERASLFAEGLYSLRKTDLALAEYAQLSLTVPASNPFDVNPFGTTSVRVNYDLRDELGVITQESESEVYALAAGGSLEFGEAWSTTLTAGYTKEETEWSANNVNNSRIAAALRDSNPATALNVFGDGNHTNPDTLLFIRETGVGTGDDAIRSLGLTADGPIFSLPAGEVRLAVGLDYRDERLNSTRGTIAPQTGIFTNASAFVGKLDRQVSAAFGELVIPLLRSSWSERPRAELSIAGRYEDYSDFGTTFNPKYGIGFFVTPDLKLRGSWGTSFRAPRLNEISPSARPSFALLSEGPDPQSASEVASLFLVTGAVPDLSEETATTWTAGLDFSPQSLPDLLVSTTYFDIDYQDKIRTGGNGDLTLLDEALWSQIIIRNPSDAQIQAFCNDPRVTLIDDCPAAADVNALIDTRLRNFGGLRVRGLDVATRYAVNFSASQLTFGLSATYTFDYAVAVSETDEFHESVDTVGSPLALRLRGFAGWNLGNWQANVLVNYADAYEDRISQREVSSWTTVDATLGYQLPGSGWIDGTRLRLGILNAFDERPPFVNAPEGYDTANASQIGRSFSVTLTKEF